MNPPFEQEPIVHIIKSVDDLERLMPVHHEPSSLADGFALGSVEGRIAETGGYRVQLGNGTIQTGAFDFTLTYNHSDGRFLTIGQSSVYHQLPHPW